MAPVSPIESGIRTRVFENVNGLTMHALEAGDPEQAAALFEREDWRGTALYRGEHYGHAAETFAHIQAIEGHYNLGNSLARAGELQGAVTAYAQTLELDPDHEDAIFNRALVESLLRESSRSQDRSGTQDATRGSSAESDQSQSASGNQEQQDDPAQSEQEQDAQAKDQQQQQQEASDPRDEQQAEKSPQELQLADAELEERRQALEQWLERVPDDPGGLLRRKFRHETQQRYREGRSRRNQEKIW